MIRLAIAGAAGRMGRALVEVCDQTKVDVRLTVATVLGDDPSVGIDSGLLASGVANGVIIVADLALHSDDFDVLIDFTQPSATMKHLEICEAFQKAIVIGTTGLNEDERDRVRSSSGQIPVILSPNMSIGVNLCFDLLEKAAKVLGNDFDVEIFEAHHRRKKDAPSGTALEMGNIVAETLGRNLDEVAVYGREGVNEPRDSSTIGFATVRAGDIVGDHTVLFAGDGERIELTHKASSRTTFSKGATKAAKYINNQTTGLFDMFDVLNLKK